MTALQVLVATIEHEHGMDTYLSLTPEELRNQIYAYVSTGWEELNAALDEDMPIPEDRDEAIELYFMKVPNEYMTWGEAVLEIGYE